MYYTFLNIKYKFNINNKKIEINCTYGNLRILKDNYNFTVSFVNKFQENFKHNK